MTRRILQIELVLLMLLFAGCNSSAPPVSRGMVHVPKGKSFMGTDAVDKDAKALQYGFRKPLYANVHPRRSINLDSFYIDKTEVTNREYKDFVVKTGHPAPVYWPGGSYPEKLTDHPVVDVSWYDADAYCKWRKKRLPTEEEWEKAARGTDGRTFPWGNEFDIKKTNALGDHEGTMAVGSYPEGASPYGALDMSGNVMEWVASWYVRYPGNDFIDEDYGEKYRVVRGGGWGGVGHYSLQVFVSTSYRNMFEPEERFNDLGFRCAKGE